jgi:L-threonylcarbamoyladenylate synthase
MTIIPADEAGIARAAEALRTGRLVAMPTETVYGLAADATQPEAVARIYAAKGRPRFNPLIAHVTDLDAALSLADLPAPAIELATRFWPGPLTLVAPRRLDAAVCDLAVAGLETIAVRAPAHPIARALLAAVARPLAAPSANRSGHVSPTRPEHAEADLGDALAFTLDGGPCVVGLESTIVGFLGGPPVLLRPGGVARCAIKDIVGPLAASGPGVQAPGMLASHYAPRARLRLDAAAPRDGETYLGFGPGAPWGAANLSPTGDLVEAAARLFETLRSLDAAGAAVIAVAPIPAEGLGEAIRDRLARAAAPR